MKTNLEITPELITQIKSLYATGKSERVIAGQFGISRWKVRKLLYAIEPESVDMTVKDDTLEGETQIQKGTTDESCDAVGGSDVMRKHIITTLIGKPTTVKDELAMRIFIKERESVSDTIALRKGQGSVMMEIAKRLMVYIMLVVIT